MTGFVEEMAYKISVMVIEKEEGTDTVTSIKQYVIHVSTSNNVTCCLFIVLAHQSNIRCNAVNEYSKQ